MGKIKEVTIDLFLGIILMAIGFALRFVVYSIYRYPMDIDTYYHLRVIRDHLPGWQFLYTIGNFLDEKGVIILFMFISILTIYYFYSLCRLYTTRFPSFIAGLFFALSPLVFFNNKFTLIDKNAPTLLLIIIILINIKIFSGWKRIIALILSFAILAWVWEGWVAMVVLYFIYLIIYILVNKGKPYYYVIIALILGGIFTYYFGTMMVLLNAKDRVLISELNPIWNIGIFAEYIIMILVFIFVFTKIRLEKKDLRLINEYLFLYVGFVLSFFAMCIIFRFNIFFLPFLYLWFAIVIEELEYKNWIKILAIIFIAIFVFGTSWKIYMQPPLMNDDLKEAMDYINTQPSQCLIGVWSLGHIYQYYTNKTVLYSAAAGDYMGQIDYMVNGKQTQCSIIYDEVDLKALDYMIKYKTNLTISRDKYYIVGRAPDKVFGRYNILNVGG